MDDNRNEAESPAERPTSQEDTAHDQPPAASAEPVASEAAPEPVDETEDTKGLESAKKPEEAEEPKEDGASQPKAASEDIEEGRAAYRPGGFHPVYIGDIFNDRFKVLNKIGYGQYSTVWLVRDLRASGEGDGSDVFRALKVLRADAYGHGYDTFERDIMKCLRDGDRRQLGFAYVCHLVTDFEHQGPNGTHICFVLELMGENLRTFGPWFPPDDMIPYPVMRRFAIQLLLALDFAHEHNVIHTDIKPDNIFLKFRDYSTIESGYLKDVPIPQQNREETQYGPIPSHPLRWYYFKEEDSRRVDQFDIALGDWGVSSWTTKHLTEIIQPAALRAPEVIIGAPWDESTDWWNLGTVLLEVFRAVRMFDGRVPPDGHYEPREHLIEIIDFFGPFPKALLKKGDQDFVRELFDGEGRIKDAEPLNRPGLLSEYYMRGLSQEVQEQFVSFLNLLMKIDPQERVSTMDLLRHPWLHAAKPLPTG